MRAVPVTAAIRILGIDPGSRVTGYGVIDVKGRDLVYVASGCIRTQVSSHIERLDIIGRGVKQLLIEYSPHEAVIEKVFVAKNADSALKLGQARAAAICRILDFLSHELVFEYSARAIKQAAVGYGGADKDQVQHMIKQMLGLSGELASDAADALAAAVCHANSRGLNSQLMTAKETRA